MKLLHEASDDEDFLDAHQQLLVEQQSTQLQLRYEEERTGLLSNKVHLDKYQSQQELINDPQLEIRT